MNNKQKLLLHHLHMESLTTVLYIVEPTWNSLFLNDALYYGG